MSKFLMVPRNVYGQLKCCTASGVSDPVPAPATPDNPFGTTYEATPLFYPHYWKLANAMGDSGAVGFGLCCGSKNVSVQFVVTADFTDLEEGLVTFILDTPFSPITFVFIELSKISEIGEPDLFQSTITKATSTTPPEVVEEITSDLFGAVHHTVTLSGLVTATACAGVISAFGGIDLGTSNPVPANITAQFSIT